MKRIIAMMVVCCGAAVFAEEEEVEAQEQVEQVEQAEQTERGKFKIERYQDLIERQMFGEPPEGYDPTKPPEGKNRRNASSSREERELEQQQEKLKSAIHFAAINVAPNGEVYVGFTDNSVPKVPRTYYLKVGEVREGVDWVVKEADAKEKTMTIENKDGIEVALTLGGDSSKGAGSTARAGGGSKSVMSSKTWKKGSLANRMFAAPDSGVKSQEEAEFGNTMRDRRKARREREKMDEAKRAELEQMREAARQEEERKKAEADAIRKEKEEETKRDLAEMKAKLEQMREMQEAKENAVKTLEENGGNGGEAPVEEEVVEE